MKRSHSVSAPLLATAALAITGCHHHPEMQRCIDEQNRVVDPSFCANLPQQYNGMGYQPGFFPYRYYYGGGGGYGFGTVVYGGGYAPVTGHSYSGTTGVSSSTSRGGFGSTHGGSGSSSGSSSASGEGAGS